MNIQLIYIIFIQMTHFYELFTVYLLSLLLHYRINAEVCFHKERLQ